MEIVITPRSLGKLERNLGPEMLRALRGAMNSTARYALSRFQGRTRNAIPASPNGGRGAVATGEYLRAWKIQRGTDTVTVLNDSNQAIFVEKGRRPGRKPPPIEPIRKWAEVRLGLQGAKARAAAVLIARAIGRRGLFPRNVMSGAMPAIQETYDRVTRRAYDRALNQAASK